MYPHEVKKQQMKKPKMSDEQKGESWQQER
jgi:hypothetical protein